MVNWLINNLKRLYRSQQSCLPLGYVVTTPGCLLQGCGWLIPRKWVDQQLLHKTCQVIGQLMIQNRAECSCRSGVPQLAIYGIIISLPYSPSFMILNSRIPNSRRLLSTIVYRHHSVRCLQCQRQRRCAAYTNIPSLQKHFEVTLVYHR